MLLRCFCVLFFLSVYCANTTAQSFRYTQFTTYNGLPIDNVYAAAQDNDGFIWFATDFGISKFDGYRFVNYDKSNGISNTSVIDIVYAGGDSLIFCSYPSTLQSIHTNGKINTLHFQNGFSMQQLTKHNDAIYFYQRGLTSFGAYINGKCSMLMADSLLQSSGVTINAIISLKEKGLAFCTNKGLCIKNSAGINWYLNDQNITCAIYTKNKTITAVSNGVIVTSDDLFRFTATSFKLNATSPILNMAEEPDGSIWLRGLDKGIYRLQHNELKEFSVQLNLVNKNVNDFFIDKDGNSFFCTGGAGILQKRNSSFINYETQDGLANNKVLQLLQHKNQIVIGTENGITVKNNNVLKTLSFPYNGIGLKYVYQLFNTGDSSIGVCIANVFKFSKDTAGASSYLYKTNIQGYPFIAFNSFYAFSPQANNYTVVSANKLYQFSNGHVTRKILLNGVVPKKVYCITVVGNQFYIGYNNGLIIAENDKTTIIDSLINKKLGQVFQIVNDSKGRLWLATDNGLFVKEKNIFRHISTGSNLAANYCRSICEDDKQRIWCATWNGLYQTDGNNGYNYAVNAGILSKTCNAVLFKQNSNELYVGTDNGLSVIDIDKLTIVKPAIPVFIEAKNADTVYVKNGCSLSSNQNSLSFYISLPYFNGTGNLQYEYKLDNADWNSSKVPEFYMPDIPAGKHTFYVRVKENEKIITVAATPFAFTVKQKFYTTWWFWLLAALLLQWILFKIINHYTKKIRNQKIATQQLQAEFASLKQQAFTSLMNPHFIFNALNSIQYYINMQDRQTANKYLSDFATLIRRSFDSAQKAFVPLEEELETVRLYLQLEKMRFTDKFNYSITLNKAAEEEEWMLPGMVLQPFLENAILHGLAPLSNNGELQINITAAQNTLYITITDNGVGIEKSKQLHLGKKHNSKGMQLIKERLQILSKLSPQPIQLTITEHTLGAENPGTTVNIIIPQQVYQSYVQNNVTLTAPQ
jgi:ligand-binding sensor domain-containing protein